MKGLFRLPLCLAFCVSSFSQARLPQTEQPKGEHRSAWQELLTYEGRDLRRINEKERYRLIEVLDTLLPNEDDRFIALFFASIQLSQSTSRYILVEGSSLITIPGSARVRVNIFDTDGNLLADDQFSTGWRIAFKEARLVKDSVIGTPIIEVSTRPVINGRDVARQYYGFLDDHVTLIRLEDSEGKAVRNMYTPDNFIIGPFPPDKAVDEWEKALMSDDAVELLQMLMWFGGTHGDVDLPPSNWPIGESPYADLRNRLRGRESVKERLRKLRESENRWVREATELAMGLR